MPRTFRSLADRWIGRNARPDPAALAAVRDLAPATVVTGASRGIGLALARRFAEAGDTVVLVARTRAPLDEAQRAITRDYGVKAIVVATDLRSPEAPSEIDKALAGAGLYMDYLVNNAGVGLSGDFADADPARIDALLALNIAALTRLTQHALVPIRARARGGILNMASLGGYAPGPYQAAYYATKAYVLSLTEAVAYEVRGEGVRVSVVAPGPVETSFHKDMGAEGARYRMFVPSLSAERVARSAYSGLMMGRRLIVPGLLPSATLIALRVLPHAITVPVIGRLLDPSPAKPRR